MEKALHQLISSPERMTFYFKAGKRSSSGPSGYWVQHLHTLWGVNSTEGNTESYKNWKVRRCRGPAIHLPHLCCFPGPPSPCMGLLNTGLPGFLPAPEKCVPSSIHGTVVTTGQKTQCWAVGMHPLEWFCFFFCLLSEKQRSEIS